jgi:hypothetical protein
MEQKPDYQGRPISDEDLIEFSTSRNNQSRILTIFGVLVIVLLIIGTVIAIAAMLNNPGKTETIRDIVIIFLAAEFSIIGLVLVILIIQLSLLTELLRDEIAPIMRSTNETLANVRGTTAFLSDNLVRPVVKVNSSIAALRRALDLIRFRD